MIGPILANDLGGADYEKDLLSGRLLLDCNVGP